MFTVELYAGIRRAVMVDGPSRREVARRFGVHRNTISKMLQFSVPPGYRRRERPASKKLGPFMAWIDTRQARRWRWTALRRRLAGKMVQSLCGSGEGVFAASESPNAFYGHCGGSGAEGWVLASHLPGFWGLANEIGNGDPLAARRFSYSSIVGL